MTVTSYGVNDSISNKLWAKKLNAEALKETYFGKFMDNEGNNIVHVKTELATNAGDNVTVGLRVQLTGDGVTEGGTLVGNEEGLSTYSDQVKINELAHAVRVKNKNTIDAQRVPFSLRTEGKNGMKDWFAGRFDTVMFNHLCGYSVETRSVYSGNNPITAPSSQRIYRAAGATDDATVNGATGSTFTIQMIDALVERAGVASPLIRPIKINGESKFVMFLHDYQVTDLRIATGAGGWLDIQKAALAGGAGSKSPIYTGALGEYNNVVLHKSNRITNGVSNAGAAQPNTRRAVLCGAQSLGLGFGKEFSNGSHYKWIEELFDYERELGVSAQTVWGLKKAVFNGQDFGTIACTTYAVAH
jgi:N4-gp56 family major capsid protein